MTLVADDLKFRFTADRLCLDLASTLGERGHRDIERLNTVEDLEHWVVESELLNAPIAASRGDLIRVKVLRCAIIAIFEGILRGQTPRQGDLRVVNELAIAAPIGLQIESDAQTLKKVAVEGYACVFSTIARDAIQLLASHPGARLKACEDAGCRMLFLDTSRTANRRWCSMVGIGCGNRAKKRSFNERHREKSS
ncbi:ABATE domain-containing protein [Paraburkholderia phymatum]|uniref:CGNR zinc finger domain-containing protein n=1 Tax=Paraburkholderia phymatum TaxID=148447 RepID=UPI00317F72EB